MTLRPLYRVAQSILIVTAIAGLAFGTGCRKKTKAELGLGVATHWVYGESDPLALQDIYGQVPTYASPESDGRVPFDPTADKTCKKLVPLYGDDATGDVDALVRKINNCLAKTNASDKDKLDECNALVDNNGDAKALFSGIELRGVGTGGYTVETAEQTFGLTVPIGVEITESGTHDMAALNVVTADASLSLRSPALRCLRHSVCAGSDGKGGYVVHKVVYGRSLFYEIHDLKLYVEVEKDDNGKVVSASASGSYDGKEGTTVFRGTDRCDKSSFVSDLKPLLFPELHAGEAILDLDRCVRKPEIVAFATMRVTEAECLKINGKK